MATDRLFNQTQGDSLLAILAQIRDGYNSVDGAFSLTSENPLQNKKITGAVTDIIETLSGTAQKSYAIGQYFLANDGYYYVATAAITAGSSNISSSTGGNCSKTCITAAMNNLSSQISNLNNKFKTINSGSLYDIQESGIYYLTANVTDKPTVSGGVYIYGRYGLGVAAGIYISEYDQAAFIVRNTDGTQTINNMAIFTSEVSGTTSGTGAIQVPSMLMSWRFLNARLTVGDPGFVVRRDFSYFTVFNADGTPKVNTAVTFEAYFC